MLITYPAQYTDEFGTEATIIINNGSSLKMTLRGVDFSGKDFHSFKIQSTINDKNSKFNLFADELCGYFIDCQIPILIVHNDEESQALLYVYIEYGRPAEVVSPVKTNLENNLGIVVETMRLEIEYQGKTYSSSGENSYSTFDEQLTELKDVLPHNFYLKICWNCSLSDYHVFAGSGVFGNLGCFRYAKNEYREVKNKFDFVALWEKQAIKVQEIHLCPEFEKRKPLGNFWGNS
jgi:hypothetical protein